MPCTPWNGDMANSFLSTQWFNDQYQFVPKLRHFDRMASLLKNFIIWYLHVWWWTPLEEDEAPRRRKRRGRKKARFDCSPFTLYCNIADVLYVSARRVAPESYGYVWFGSAAATLKTRSRCRPVKLSRTSCQKLTGTCNLQWSKAHCTVCDCVLLDAAGYIDCSWLFPQNCTQVCTSKCGKTKLRSHIHCYDSRCKYIYIYMACDTILNWDKAVGICWSPFYVALVAIKAVPWKSIFCWIKWSVPSQVEATNINQTTPWGNTMERVSRHQYLSVISHPHVKKNLHCLQVSNTTQKASTKSQGFGGLGRNCSDGVGIQWGCSRSKSFTFTYTFHTYTPPILSYTLYFYHFLPALCYIYPQRLEKFYTSYMFLNMFLWF